MLSPVSPSLATNPLPKPAPFPGENLGATILRSPPCASAATPSAPPANTEPDVHLAMLSHGYPFDACQLPVSAIEANSNAFVRRVLPELTKQGIAPLAMKSLGGNADPIRDKILTVHEALTYVLSQPVTTLVSAINNIDQLRENAATAAAFSPCRPPLCPPSNPAAYPPPKPTFTNHTANGWLNAHATPGRL